MPIESKKSEVSISTITKIVQQSCTAVSGILPPVLFVLFVCVYLFCCCASFKALMAMLLVLVVAGTAGSWWRRWKEAGGCSLWTTVSRETLPRATSCACQTSSVPSLHKPLSAAWSMSCPWVGLGQSVVENGYFLYMGRSWPVSCRKLVFHMGRFWPELKTGALHG